MTAGSGHPLAVELRALHKCAGNEDPGFYCAFCEHASDYEHEYSGWPCSAIRAADALDGLEEIHTATREELGRAWERVDLLMKLLRGLVEVAERFDDDDQSLRIALTASRAALEE
jgi:hypothetical protein